MDWPGDCWDPPPLSANASKLKSNPPSDGFLATEPSREAAPTSLFVCTVPRDGIQRLSDLLSTFCLHRILICMCVLCGMYVDIPSKVFRKEKMMRLALLSVTSAMILVHIHLQSNPQSKIRKQYSEGSDPPVLVLIRTSVN